MFVLRDDFRPEMPTMRSCLSLYAFGLTALMGSIPLSASAQSVAQRASTEAATTAADDSLLMNREWAQWDALKARDTLTFGRLLGADLVDVDVSGIKRTSPATTARYVMGCQTASYTLADSRVAHYATTTVVTYKATIEQTCWGQKAPSPLYVMTVYERRAGRWEPVAHSETPAARY